MNGLANLAEVLENGKNEIQIDPVIGQRAKRSIQRMLDFAQGLNLTPAVVQVPGAGQHGMGPA